MSIYTIIKGELLAPVIVNIEADKLYANNFAVTVEPSNKVFNFFPKSIDENDLQNTIICSEIFNVFVRQLFLKCGRDEAVINGIDNITVFAGNKMDYYAKDQCQQVKPSTIRFMVMVKYCFTRCCSGK